MESDQESIVSDRIVNEENGLKGNWCWRNNIRGRSHDDLSNLNDLLTSSSNLTTEEDGWLWMLKSNGIFQMNVLSSLIDNIMLAVSGPVTANTWLPCLPNNVNVFIWRLAQHGIATRNNLVHRGMNLPSTLCPFCDAASEEVNHLFTSCRFINPLWKNFLSWWRLSDSIPNRSFNALSPLNYQLGSNNASIAFLATRFTLLWLIWKWRNKLEHSPSKSRKSILNEDIMASLKAPSHLWLSCRSKLVQGDFENWRSNLISVHEKREMRENFRERELRENLQSRGVRIQAGTSGN
ncbi:uncharacterized protein [Rutidosis leptorrhynchoides]|uniref:uncharacterized protein n=1 Tax=Rutidosis leptorrhynchoides TaxID=125765 RepID=UPI003A9A5A7E